jgi:CheY-like chemotaxis protein
MMRIDTQASAQRHTARRTSLNNKRPIIVIDGYPPTCASMADILRDEGYIADCYTWEQSAEQLQAKQPALIIADLLPLDYQATLRLIEELRQHPATRAIPVIVTTTTARLPHEVALALSRLGCTSLVKPFDIDTFLSQVGQALGEGQPASGGWCLLALA